MSRVTAIISALVICIIVCLSWAVNHYRDNAIPYKAQRDKKCRSGWRTRQLRNMQMRQRDVLRSMQNTRRLACKTESGVNTAWWCCPLVVVGCTSKQSVSQCVKPPPPPAWMSASPTGRHRWWDYFTLREADHYAKTTGRNPEVY